MSFGATPVDGSATPIPMPTVVADGSTQPVVTAGGPSYSDSGNTKAPVSIWIKDGNNVSFGAQADAVATSDTGTFSFMALFKRALQKLTSLVTNTNAFSSLGTDQTGTELKVSVYGTNAVGGDTALGINGAGNLKVNISGVSAGVAITTNQTGTPTETPISVGTSSTTVLAANANRKYLLLVNDSPNIIYLSFAGAAVLNQGVRLNANGGSILLDRYVPTGTIKGISAVAASNLLVSEG